MIGNLLQPELAEFIRQRDFTKLREALDGFPPAEVAEIIADVSAEDKAVLLRVLPRHQATEVFEYLCVEDQESLLRALGKEDVAKILNELAPDDRTALLEELPASATQMLLQLLQPDERKIAIGLLGYPKNSVGRKMTPRYVSIQQGWTVEQVLAHLRKVGRDQDTLNQMYVVDSKGVLVARVRLRNLVVSELSCAVSELLEQPVFGLNVTDNLETAVQAFQKYDLSVLPVVDSQGCLVGVVTVDDILEVAEREATEDMQRLGGMEALDAPYLSIGLGKMIRKRAGWLALLFLGEMLTATAMGYFEDEISKAVVLALFVPLIISSGGNSGSQATSLIIRAMAVQDVTLADWWRVLWRELIAGIALGSVLALIAVLRIVAWPSRDQLYGSHYMLIATTVACSLIGVVLFGSLVGAMLPFVLRRLGFDPAVSSAPLVATLVDVTGLVIYFSVAFAILHPTLL